MEIAWRLDEEISTEEEFSLTQAFTLESAADAFLFSDLLGDWIEVGRHSKLSGQFSGDHKLSGKYEPEHNLSGRYTPDHRLEGDA